MNQRILIYTIAPLSTVTPDLPLIHQILNKTPGRIVESIDVQRIKPPKPTLIKDRDGHNRFSWDWFKQTFHSDRHNVVCYHITPAYKKKYKLPSDINGTYLRDADDALEFWICAGEGDAKGYFGRLTEFQRVFLHEMAHGDSYRAGVPKAWQPTDYVHFHDYILKAIDRIPLSYTAHNISQTIVEKLKTIINLYGQLTRDS